ncbi:restriction endonuclease subunit S, partial [Mesorhizobium intechi]
MTGVESVGLLLNDRIDLWSSAIARRSSAGRGRSKKFSLYGIKKLRTLILDLAVRGKLVMQDPNDVSATVLLRRFRADNIDRIAKKRMRNGKQLPPVHADEIRYKAPDGWLWIRLNELGDWGSGATPNRKRSEYFGGEIPWFKSGELTSDFISISEESVSDLALEECSLRLNRPGDVLIAMYGATIGKTSILAVEGTTNQAVCACAPFEGAFNRYLLTALKAMRPLFVEQGAGGAQPNISREKIIATAFALPPEAEQHRIVAKVDELMVLCDRLEAGTYEAIDAHQLLVTELLATLTSSQDAGQLAENWARIEAHFDTLFATEDSVDQLKQTILQLAVMGRMVPQDPKDEPASELLKRVKVDWLRQVSERGMRGAKVPTFLARDVENYSYPETWKVVPLGQLAVVTDPNPSHRYPDYNGGTIPLLSTQEFSGEDGWDHSTAKLTTEAFWKFQQEICAFEEGDIIFARKGRLGLPRFLPPFDRYTFSHTLFVIKPMGGVDPNYLLWFLRRQQTVD